MLAVVLVAGLVSVQTSQAEPGKDRPQADPWAGRYVAHGDWLKGAVVIKKEGDVYRLSRKPYDGYPFREVRPGVLENPDLGRIYKGSLRFEDRRPAVTVLHYEFCYESGDLIAAGG
jgi:hypothetical protein